ncbi:hypothetical protein BCR37DRAFT_54586 [Protomyces lactucae-debilis]|uniref:Extracellular membrane protein CFEM domain-containing protein n=1 Tax=Protomyces lactucae-debilis TaxID=2754530 RepID=A0A1Y2FAE2_PROLT|nr:uncharacterized protein BCR37DRAFT_54586 [Protomyces lactucae-debilis]ORY80843.1 hypothetical protein BCR37DRAFT_54586 [Protomyces lactucae-debilis]
MRAPSTTAFLWLFLISLYTVLLHHNVTATAVRTKRPSSSQVPHSRKRPKLGTSTSAPAAGGTVIPLPGTAKHSSHSNDPNDEGNEPECRNVSVGYHIMFNPAEESANEPETSGVRPIHSPSTLALASREPCFTPCERKITDFINNVARAAKARTERPPKCWASRKFSVVQRRARSVGCDASLALGCSLPPLCECTFNLMVPDQMDDENKSAAYSTKSICDLHYFPAIISIDLVSIGKDPRTQFTNLQLQGRAAVAEQSWPLFGWRSMPGKAVQVAGPYSCPKPEKTLPSWKSRESRANKIVKEICLCPNNQAYGLEGDPLCSHRELVCETITMTQAMDNLRRGGGDLLGIYMGRFPQLKEYVEPIPGTAIAANQVQRQDWERMLPAAASNLAKGLTFDLNLAAPENDEDGHEL